MDPIQEEKIFMNGVDGTTGDYLVPALSVAELGEMARQDELQTRQLGARQGKKKEIPMGVKEGIDPRRLEEAGWAVIFAEDADPALREALAPLLERRRTQAGQIEPRRYRELAGRDGYRPGESKLRFLARHGVGSGPADPDRLPYYLLLIGGPESIPYEFQYQLDVQYAVGRVAFDTPEEYGRYAAAVVSAEQRPSAAKRAAFFSVRKDGDSATERIHDLLVEPLARRLMREVPDWDVRSVCGPEATKERLGRLLGGDETPALLFTASHGLVYPRRNPGQRDGQGALVCQEWSGPGSSSANGSSPYFTAADVVDDACPSGLVAFFFACFSAGTPRSNGFAHRGAQEPRELADRPFVARLPQRLLSHPGGGALAVVGHVDRAWTYSFDWPLAGPQREVFASTLKRLMAGHPLGSAMECFNQRYAELECDLAALRREMYGDLLTEGQLWTARNDARNFLVLGDPAVRLTGNAA